ncbi:unnamed protein product [Ostreobium quekettii]|uniref:Uncharacterized protein n=1 Tax=Ostreobium quekettii TaxID=121088 RepID=A0A8S1IWZ7_9CHLO|nr:unnamed protein product [Ostreobium quekettii]|eukprot:evm.model.scf_723.8 EVM.evm.TU.scf_723.8   scf_723:52354-53274(+)
MLAPRPVKVPSAWPEVDKHGPIDLRTAEDLVGVAGCSPGEASLSVRRREATGCTIPMPWTVHIEGGQEDEMVKPLAPSSSVGSGMSSKDKVDSGVEMLVLVRKNRSIGPVEADVLDSAKQAGGLATITDVSEDEGKAEEPPALDSFSFAPFEQESPITESAFTNGPSFQICAGSPLESPSEKDWRMGGAAVRGASHHDGPMGHDRWPSICSVGSGCSCPLCNMSRGLGSHSKLRLSQTEFQECSQAEDFLNQFRMEAPIKRTLTETETQSSTGSLNLRRDKTVKMRGCVDFGAHCFPSMSASSWLS